LQKLNALIHVEPLRTVSHHLFWFVVLVFVAPMAGIVLLVSGAVDSARRLLLLLTTTARIDPKEDDDGVELAVLVTGCDSGLGRALVLRLAEEGFTVFAGCLNIHRDPTKETATDDPPPPFFADESSESASTSSRIRPLRMDVTNQEDVDRARRTVEDWLAGGGGGEDASSSRRRRRFHALVNNAGIVRFAFFDWLDQSDYEACLAVNCLGQIRTCKAFLPIFKKQAKEDASSSTTTTTMRIVNVNSLAGQLPSGHIACTAYEVSKNAAVSFTDGLRLELKMWGIDVVSVDPSFHASPMADPDAIRAAVVVDLWEKRIPPGTREEYGDGFLETYVDHLTRCVRSGLWEMGYLTDSIVDRCILSKASPPAQIAFGSDARFVGLLLRMLPPAWRQSIFLRVMMPPLVPAALTTAAAASTTTTEDAEGKKPKRA